ncbi:MAG: hypothetical protein M3N07_02225 [Pseudomonadota bacterium]|nr:hypothetical protein [Pseudomonadota bacterium]
MTVPRILLVAGWAGIVAITVWAMASLGLAAGVSTFVGDFAHPWRAQFYADLELQLLVFAGWVLWRERSPARGLAFAAATMLLGALFTLAYLLAASFSARGDARALLLGARA